MPLIAELDQGIVADVVDIFGTHPFEHFTEQIELLVGVGRVGDVAAPTSWRSENNRTRCDGDREKTRTLHSLTL